ncbi:unnamed protein product [Aphanomyces euteiches]
MCMACILSRSSRQSNQDEEIAEYEYPLDYDWEHPWPKPPTLPQEETRLDVLQSYAILDTPTEDVFDIIVNLASEGLKCPIAGVSFIDKDRQWLKARTGLNHEEIPRSVSICAHAIFSDKPMVVFDTLKDKRFAKNPLVTGAVKIRFYAGCPIVTANGHALGTVFVFDNEPHESCDDVNTLQKLANVAMKNLEERTPVFLPTPPEFGYELDMKWEHPWPKPPVLPLEDKRLEALKSYNILDAPKDDALAMICDLACNATKCPIAGVSFIDENRQWFQATVGLQQLEIPRSVSFCAHTIFSDKAMIVLDTLKDKRFAQNPLVTGAAKIRFYAGFPIICSSGYALGTVFVFDIQPHTTCDVEALEKLSNVAMKHLEDRKKTLPPQKLATTEMKRVEDRNENLLSQEVPATPKKMNDDYGYELDFRWEYSWPKPPILQSEDDRLEDLRSYAILDSSTEDVFQITCELASNALKCPIAAVSFIDTNRQWFLASVGLTQKEIPRNVSFCAHTIVSTESVVVLDTINDMRFAKNPMVTGKAAIRFYAGSPIVSPRGHVLGTVFVFDTKPRDTCDTATLEKLSNVVMKNLEDRKEMILAAASPAESMPITGEGEQSLSIRQPTIPISASPQANPNPFGLQSTSSSTLTTQATIQSIQDVVKGCLSYTPNVEGELKPTFQVACSLMELCLKFRINKEDILMIGEMVGRITRQIILQGVPENQMDHLPGLSSCLEAIHAYLDDIFEKTQGWNLLMDVTQRDATAKAIATKVTQLQGQLQQSASFLNVDLNVQVVGSVDDLMEDMHSMMDKLRRMDYYIGSARQDGTTNKQVDILVEMAIQLQRGLDFYHNNVSLRNLQSNQDFEASVQASFSKVVDAAKDSWRAKRTKQELPLHEMMEEWMLSSHDVEYSSTNPATFLGQGASASVYLGQYKGRSVAVKHFHTVKMSNSSELEQLIRKEIKAWKDVTNEPYILTLIGVCTKIVSPILVCEYCPDTITRYVRYHPQKLVTMVYQFALGLVSLHDAGIIHRDLKGGNVLVREDGTVAIADFGLSRSAASLLTQYSNVNKFVGTLNWMSPEQRFSPRKVTVQSDIWSFGMTVWELLSGDIPYRDYCQEEIEDAIRSEDDRPEHPDELLTDHEPLWRLITRCWKVNPLERPTARDIVDYLETHYGDDINEQMKDKLGRERATSTGGSRQSIYTRKDQSLAHSNSSDNLTEGTRGSEYSYVSQLCTIDIIEIDCPFNPTYSGFDTF